MKALLSTNHFGLADTFPFMRGKVRDVCDLGTKLLIIATDRVSAFDVVLPNGIPGRGIILTQMTINWLNYLGNTIAKLQTSLNIRHHIISTDVNDLPLAFQSFANELKGRFMIVEKCLPIPVEFILRGNITGSFWKEYGIELKKSSGDTLMLHGHELPTNLLESQEFPKPLFTPSTKAEQGQHDENIDETAMLKIITTWTEKIGRDTPDPRLIAKDSKALTMALFSAAKKYAAPHGIIIADTKFELGLSPNHGDASIVIIDEVLSPDSSRFWPAGEFEIGRPQNSFDKQIIRDYLNTLDWDKTAPGPELPEDIVKRTATRYSQCAEMLFGGKV